MRTAARSTEGERGAIVLVFALALTATLLGAGLAVDLGVAYRMQAALHNAVDAAALAAAHTTADDSAGFALAVARANYDGDGRARYTLATSLRDGTPVVEVRGEYDVPTYFSRLIGKQSIPVRAVGTAARIPLDVSLVLDTSASLRRQGVLQTLKEDSSLFLRLFDPATDRVGVVAFATIAEPVLALSAETIRDGERTIQRLQTMIDTNLAEGLRAAHDQLAGAPARLNARRFAIIITDGRPTAFRATIGVPFSPPGTFDGVVAAEPDGSGYRGLFALDGRRVKFWTGAGTLNTAANESSTASPPALALPGLQPFAAAEILTRAREEARARAQELRATGVTLIAVALEPPNPRHTSDVPNIALLRELVNEEGISAANEPQGRVLRATPENLAATLTKVAALIRTVRLTPAALGS